MEQSSRRLRRFYSQDKLPSESQVFCLPPEESRHLGQILRLKPGDSCLVLDSQGVEVQASFRGFKPDGRAELMVVRRHETKAVTSCPIRIYQAIPKGVKFETLIQKAQEIGLSAVIPLVTERTIVRIDPKKESPKMVRWHKIAAEAAKQSGCRTALEIASPMSLPGAIDSLGPKSIVAVLHPVESAMPLKVWAEHLADQKDSVSFEAINLFIGPEGGFSRREIESLEKAAVKNHWGFHLIGLGPSILKTDTAFIGIAAFLKFWLE